MKRNEYISAPLCLLANMIMAYLAYLICRLAFLVENWSMFSANITWSSFGEMLKGGWMFDTSAILYTNALYAMMMLLPLHHIFGISVTYMMLAHGVALGVCPDFRRIYEAV